MEVGEVACDVMKPEVRELEEPQPDWPAFVEWYSTDNMAEFIVAQWMLARTQWERFGSTGYPVPIPKVATEVDVIKLPFVT